MHVPDLGAKIALLLRFSATRTRAQLAEKLDVTISTFNGWINGSGKSKPEWVPDNRWPSLVQIFHDSLPKQIGVSEVEKLLLGRVGELDNAFRQGESPTLDEILSREGRSGSATLCPCPGLGLVEVLRDDNAEMASIALNEPFMVAVEIRRGGYALVLNNAGYLWGVIEFADGSLSPRVNGGQIVIPGVKNYKFLCMTEKYIPGPQRIAVFIAPEPFPPEILSAYRNKSTLDSTLLNQLASHMSEQPPHLREMHVLDFMVRKS
ncbi:MAG: hypothetical protein KDK08_28565 [Rhizobiaceae bacterium]|nr:hypothetical protein [Rhizobiaceae bacterium]